MLKARIALATAALLPLSLLTGCGSSGPSVLVYNAQHEQLIDQVAKAFEKKTGVKVELRNGEDLSLANTLAKEGKASHADVFLTENSPAMQVIDKLGLFAKLQPKTLAPIPAQYRPADGDWTGFAARTTALVYNPSKVKPGELPTSILDLARPQWKGRVTFSPTGADFQAIVSAVLALKGEAVTKKWLEGLKANATFVSTNNLVVMKAVDDGRADIGIFYHYYWYRDRAESAANSSHTKLLILGHQDPGAFLSTSGAGVLKNSKHPKEAQEFVQFLTSTEGQKVIASSYAKEYTLNPAAPLQAPEIRPLAKLQPPRVSPDQLDAAKVKALLQAVGLT